MSDNCYHPNNGERWFVSFRVTNTRLKSYGHRRMVLDWLGFYMQFPDHQSAIYYTQDCLRAADIKVVRARQDHGHRRYDEALADAQRSGS